MRNKQHAQNSDRLKHRLDRQSATLKRQTEEYINSEMMMGYSGGSDVKKLACNAEMWVRSLGQEDPLEKGIATHSSIGQGILVGCRLWDHTELDMTEATQQLAASILAWKILDHTYHLLIICMFSSTQYFNGLAYLIIFL